VLVVVLLAGTAAAFAVTETQKLREPPLTATKVDKVFSPVCRCPTRLARIRFQLTRRNRLQVAIVRDGKVVRTLEGGKLYGRGPKHFEWNGRDDAGRVVKDGSYDPRVTVGGQTISLPNPIRVDTVKPRIRAVGRVVFARRSVRLTVTYRLSEAAHPILYVDGKRVVYGRWQRRAGAIHWSMRLHLPKGASAYLAPTVAAEDLAGNLSRPAVLRIER
jgi:hypothetical protein